MPNKNLAVVITVSALTASAVAALAFFGFSAWQGRGAGDQDMGRMMREMMGVEQIANVPVKTLADRIERLAFTAKNSVKEFQLTAEPIRWEYAEGKTLLAWGYNGQIPGPEIRVTEGDRVRIVFTNKLPKATSIHWHGIDVPFEQDGVPGVTQKAIQPGETFSYEFVAKPAGTRFYHTHGGAAMMDEAQQLDMGLSGAFIIEPRDYQKPDKEYTLILDEWNTMGMTGMNKLVGSMMSNNIEAMMGMAYNVFTINGRAFPYAEPIAVKKGERVRLRLINAGTSTIHPMHLHGHQFKIVATDGNPVPAAAQLTRNTLPIHPGETYDIEFVANNPGIWLFHCHELHHAGGGMIVPLIYDGYSLPAPSKSPAGHTMPMH